VASADIGAHAAAATTALGIAFAISGAGCNAGSVVQTRRLTETASSIVFYFSVICTLTGLASWPLSLLAPAWQLDWLTPTWSELAALVTVGLCGGIGHILLTESYRRAPASLVAPFDYTAMVWAFPLGYFFFNELPTIHVFIGAAIIAGAGLFVIWRERRLGLQRKAAVRTP